MKNLDMSTSRHCIHWLTCQNYSSRTCQRWVSLFMFYSFCYNFHCWFSLVLFCRLAICKICKIFPFVSPCIHDGPLPILSPPVPDPANTRSTSWWWRHAPLTPLCIKSSSSLQSKVGLNLNIGSLLLKKDNEFAYSNSKFDSLKFVGALSIAPTGCAIISILPIYFVFWFVPCSLRMCGAGKIFRTGRRKKSTFWHFSFDLFFLVFPLNGIFF